MAFPDQSSKASTIQPPNNLHEYDIPSLVPILVQFASVAVINIMAKSNFPGEKVYLAYRL